MNNRQVGPARPLLPRRMLYSVGLVGMSCVQVLTAAVCLSDRLLSRCA